VANDLNSKMLNSSVYKFILLRPGSTAGNAILQQPSSTKNSHPSFDSSTALPRLGHSIGEEGIAQGIWHLGALQTISNYAFMTPEQIMAGSAVGQVFDWQFNIGRSKQK
jgi:hypothetical protein